MHQKIIVLEAEPFNEVLGKVIYDFFQRYPTRKVQWTPQTLYRLWYHKTLEDVGLTCFSIDYRSWLYDYPCLMRLVNDPRLDDMVEKLFHAYCRVMCHETRFGSECHGLHVTALHLYLLYPIKEEHCVRHPSHHTVNTALPHNSELSCRYANVPESHIRRIKKDYLYNDRRSGIQPSEMDSEIQQLRAFVEGNNTFLGD